VYRAGRVVQCCVTPGTFRFTRRIVPRIGELWLIAQSFKSTKKWLVDITKKWSNGDVGVQWMVVFQHKASNFEIKRRHNQLMNALNWSKFLQKNQWSWKFWWKERTCPRFSLSCTGEGAWKISKSCWWLHGALRGIFMAVFENGALSHFSSDPLMFFFNNVFHVTSREKESFPGNLGTKRHNVGKTIINHPQFHHFYRWNVYDVYHSQLGGKKLHCFNHISCQPRCQDPPPSGPTLWPFGKLWGRGLTPADLEDIQAARASDGRESHHTQNWFYPLVNLYSLLLKMAIDSGFTIKNCDFP